MSQYCKVRCNICKEEIGSIELPDGDIQIMSGDISLRTGLASDIDLIIDDCHDHCEVCSEFVKARMEGKNEGYYEGMDEGFLKGLYYFLSQLKELVTDSKILDVFETEYNTVKKGCDRDRKRIVCDKCYDYDDGVKEGMILGIAEGHIGGCEHTVVYLMSILIEMLQEGKDKVSITSIVDTLGKEGAFQQKTWTDLKTKFETINALSKVHKKHSKDVKKLCNATFYEFDQDHSDFYNVVNLQSILINLSPELLKDEKVK